MIVKAKIESALIWLLVFLLSATLWIPVPRAQAAEGDEWFEGFEYPMRTGTEGPWPIEEYWDKLNSTDDPNLVVEGERAAVWTNTYWRSRVFTKPALNLPMNGTSYNVLEFHANSVNATGQVNTILVLAPNASNAFYYEFPTNWTGPRKIVIPLAEFQRIGSPNWAHVTQMELLSRFREHEPENPNHTTIYLDAMRLYNKPLTVTLPEGAVHSGIRGGEAVVPVQLNHHGEAADTFAFVIPDSASDIILPEQMTGTVQPGEPAVVNVRIRIREDAPIGEEMPFRFEVHSAAENDTSPVEVRIVAQNRLEAVVVRNDLETHRGEEASFEFHLTNNSASLEAPYEIRLPEELAEEAVLEQGFGMLSPIGTATAVLVFPVPEDAPLGKNENVITVYSAADDAEFQVPIRYEVLPFLRVAAKEPDDGYKLAVSGSRGSGGPTKLGSGIESNHTVKHQSSCMGSPSSSCSFFAALRDSSSLPYSPVLF